MNLELLDSNVRKVLDEVSVIYEVLECDPELADTAAFCDHYGFDLSQAANTLLVASKKTDPIRYAVCVLLATTRLDVNKKVCELLEAKRASFADAETTQRLTGMMLGGVTAIGIEGLPVYVDAAVMEQNKVIMGGGNRLSKVLLDPKELLKLKYFRVIEDLAKPKE